MTARRSRVRAREPDYASAIAEIMKHAGQGRSRAVVEECRLDIAEAVECYIFYSRSAEEEIATRVIKGAKRAEKLAKCRDDLDRLVSECRALLKRPRYIDPLVWALESDEAHQDWDEAARYVAALQAVLKRHAEWFRSAARLAHKQIPGRGNSGSLERNFVGNLAEIFEHHTGTVLAKNVSQKPNGTGDTRYTGPLVRFVKSVVGANSTLSIVDVRWGAMVKEHFKDRKKRPESEIDRLLRRGRRDRLLLRYGLPDIGK